MLDAEKKQVLTNRLKSIEGHIRGIERMVDEDAYCMEIIKQIKAVQQALERVSALTLENHLNTCVTTAIRSDDDTEKARVVNEIMDVFKATGKLYSYPPTSIQSNLGGCSAQVGCWLSTYEHPE